MNYLHPIICHNYGAIAAAYNSGHRYYHTLRHVHQFMENAQQHPFWGLLDQSQKEAVQLVAYYHDIVWFHGGKHNEQQSACVFENHAREYARRPPESRSHTDFFAVRLLIEATRFHGAWWKDADETKTTILNNLLETLHLYVDCADKTSWLVAACVVMDSDVMDMLHPKKVRFNHDLLFNEWLAAGEGEGEDLFNSRGLFHRNMASFYRRALANRDRFLLSQTQLPDFAASSVNQVDAGWIISVQEKLLASLSPLL